MPVQDPAERLSPRTTTLPAGTELWRCHATERPAACFNPHPAATPFRGSRFDATAEDPYPFLYVAREPATALAETLLRDKEFGSGPDGGRLVPWAQARRYSLSRLTTAAPLELILLVTEEDLAAIGQDAWLLEAAGPLYAHTRFWARALRAGAAGAHGMVWQSRRHRPRLACVLFGDRCGETALKAEPAVTHDLATVPGRRHANGLLAALRTVIAGPGDGH
jgi:hypothetical protein